MSENINQHGRLPHENKEAQKITTVTLGALNTHPMFADGLPDGATIHRDNTGAVIVRMPIAARHDISGKVINSGCYSEMRVDAGPDAAHIAAGRRPWYLDAIDAQKSK